ncbi:hypothetical protein DPSP01_014406 [Paraphaeosphaeria sporulosa]
MSFPPPLEKDSGLSEVVMVLMKVFGFDKMTREGRRTTWDGILSQYEHEQAELGQRNGKQTIHSSRGMSSKKELKKENNIGAMLSRNRGSIFSRALPSKRTNNFGGSDKSSDESSDDSSNEDRNSDKGSDKDSDTNSDDSGDSDNSNMDDMTIRHTDAKYSGLTNPPRGYGKAKKLPKQNDGMARWSLSPRRKGASVSGTSETDGESEGHNFTKHGDEDGEETVRPSLWVLRKKR